MLTYNLAAPTHGPDQNPHIQPSQHSTLIGWAADGFPVYALYGYEDGRLRIRRRAGQPR